MVDLWDAENVELRLDGMRIFDTLLASPHQLFIDNLIGQYLGKNSVCSLYGRQYIRID